MGDLLLRRHGALRSRSVGIVCVAWRAAKAIRSGIHGETGGRRRATWGGMSNEAVSGC